VNGPAMRAIARSKVHRKVAAEVCCRSRASPLFGFYSIHGTPNTKQFAHLLVAAAIGCLDYDPRISFNAGEFGRFP